MSGRRLWWLGACAALACAPGPAGSPPAAEPLALQASEPSHLVPQPEPLEPAVPEEPAPEEPAAEAPATPPEEPVRHPFHDPVAPNGKAPAMRTANLSPAACRAELARRKLPARRVGGNVPGIATPVRLDGEIGGVRFVAPGGKSPYGLLDCRLLLALDELAAVLVRHGVARVWVDNFYRPRARLPGKAKRSQHAYGLAMDVMRFELRDGRTLSVEHDWHGAIGRPACGPESNPDAPSEQTVALRNLVCDLGRAGVFHHLLTPNFDAAHRDHLHLDIQRGARAVIVH